MNGSRNWNVSLQKPGSCKLAMSRQRSTPSSTTTAFRCTTARCEISRAPAAADRNTYTTHSRSLYRHHQPDLRWPTIAVHCVWNLRCQGCLIVQNVIHMHTLTVAGESVRQSPASYIFCFFFCALSCSPMVMWIANCDKLLVSFRDGRVPRQRETQTTIDKLLHNNNRLEKTTAVKPKDSCWWNRCSCRLCPCAARWKHENIGIGRRHLLAELMPSGTGMTGGGHKHSHPKRGRKALNNRIKSCR